MKIVRKACYKDIEAYSAFEGYLTEATDPDEPPEDPGERELEETDLVKYLKEMGVEKVVISGLATDFWRVLIFLSSLSLSLVPSSSRLALISPA